MNQGMLERIQNYTFWLFFDPAHANADHYTKGSTGLADITRQLPPDIIPPRVGFKDAHLQYSISLENGALIAKGEMAFNYANNENKDLNRNLVTITWDITHDTSSLEVKSQLPQEA